MPVMTLYEEVENVLTNRLKNALRTDEIINAPDWVSDLAQCLALGDHGRETRSSGAASIRPPRVGSLRRGKDRREGVKETAETLLVGAVLAVLAAATVFMMVELLN